jgi:WD40 repeat protein
LLQTVSAAAAPVTGAATNGAGVGQTVEEGGPRIDLRPTLPALKHFAEVTCARFRPGGKQLLTSSLDNGARVWETATGRLLSDLSEHDQGVLYAEFSAKGQVFVTASADDTARVWNSSTGDWLTGPFQHQGDVTLARFSLDGEIVVTLCDDRQARLWKTADGSPLGAPLSHSEKIINVIFSADRQTFLTATSRGVQRARLLTGRSVGGPLGFEVPVTDVEFSSDGRWVVGWTPTPYERARVWDTIKLQPAVALPGATNVALARFGPDDRELLTVDRSGTATLWDTRSGAARKTFTVLPSVTAAKFSANGRWLALGDREGNLQIVSLTHPEWRAPAVRRHTKAITWIEFNSNGDSLATASADGTALLWTFGTVRANR